MGQSVDGRLRQEIERIVAEGRRVDVVANAGTIAAKLFETFPESGMTAFEIHWEIVRRASNPDNPAGPPTVGLGV